MDELERRRTHAFSVIAMLALCLCGSAAFSSNTSDPALDLERLEGTWKLDWDESDPFEPVMKALEVPWFLRKLVGVIPVQINIEVRPPSCDACSPQLHVEQRNPVRQSERTIELDGVARPAVDPLGNETVDKFTWSPESGMEMFRERTLGSGKSARIHERRKVEDDLRTMVSTMTVWIDDVEHATVRRVMRKVEP